MDIVPPVQKRVAILGSTGSIGCNALAVIRHLGDPYRIVALSANKQIGKLLEQVKAFHPTAVGICDESQRGALESTGAKVYFGSGGLSGRQYH